LIYFSPNIQNIIYHGFQNYRSQSGTPVQETNVPHTERKNSEVKRRR